VDAAFARRLAPTALTLYRPLPARIADLMTLLRFGARGLGRDLGMILLMGLLTGVVGMLTPVASGVLMQDVLPRADLSLHIAVIAGLGAAALGNAAFSVVEAIATTRVQARIDLAAQAGVWSRLLRLPTRFFRANATGDLADRANGVSEIRRAVTGAVTQSVLSGLFSLLSGGLLFWYNMRLALLATGFTLLVVMLEGLLFAVELPRRRAVTAANGKVDAVTFETLSAMTKLRTAAAEPRAFARWSDDFADQARLRRRAANVDILRDVLGGVIPLFATALLFAGAIGLLGGGAAGEPAFTFGDFVAFQGAFGNFIGGVMSLVAAGEALVAVAPVWERLRPILSATQETGVGRAPVGTLRGTLAVSNVTFSYDAAVAPVLKNVSLTIQAGEYVAFVGPSGSGKSTLIRVMLGLEQPQSGAAYIDGMDLSTIDLAAMRRQFGVVMQGGQLSPGNIMENILGSAPLPEARAWEAARQAGLEADIRAMPMQMFTVLSEGGGGLSGGQKQRLLIARALVRRPRVLLFDEATSALDNATQSEVKQTLDRLNVTRIVVAHRLSTIRDVHRIVVMQGGRIVEEGAYDALIERGGLFSRLAARQLA
jgi:ATP-binding cassette subfamily C protein